ncbi:hypothetical protein Thimo_3389 [Thioflavicoccus mobilis 8321]|uniref:Uncharacterized protein n=1 Tax=Thioflavicoccus mobilis 8321 TaxID=765912 RepID=L0H398_9GAMM|nr:hypothetical protein Thimo_3389 [Thioflavicoccus mobilis 8321]
MSTVVKRSGEEMTVEVTVRLSGSLLEMEGAIQEAANAVGRCATEEALQRFDTDGRAMRVGEIKLTARGGRIYCPLEQGARIVRGATSRFASQLSHK